MRDPTSRGGRHYLTDPWSYPPLFALGGLLGGALVGETLYRALPTLALKPAVLASRYVLLESLFLPFVYRAYQQWKQARQAKKNASLIDDLDLFDEYLGHLVALPLFYLFAWLFGLVVEQSSTRGAMLVYWSFSYGLAGLTLGWAALKSATRRDPVPRPFLAVGLATPLVIALVAVAAAYI